MKTTVVILLVMIITLPISAKKPFTKIDTRSKKQKMLILKLYDITRFFIQNAVHAVDLDLSSVL